MTLLTVCQDVCEVVGVMRPASIFSGLAASRTQQELLALANDMAQRIAYDTRDWTMLKQGVRFTGDSSTIGFDLPPEYQRMLKTTNVWRSTSTVHPMVFYPDLDEWVQRRAAYYYQPWGEWTIYANQIHIWPIMAGPVAAWRNNFFYAAGAKAVDTVDGTQWKTAVQHVSASIGTFATDRAANPTYWVLDGPAAWRNNFSYAVGVKALDTIDRTQWQAAVQHISASVGTFAADRAANPTYWTSIPVTVIPPVSASFAFIDNRCIQQSGAPGGIITEFQADGDSFRLSERLLKLGMIWQWQAQKGTPYAESMNNYEDALAMLSGSDSPAPIIIGRKPFSSAANVALPWPPDWGSVTR